MKKLVLVGIAALVAAGAAMAAPAVSGPTLSNCGKQVTKPKTLVISCADHNYLLKGLKWSSWGGTSASGSGTASANTCTPNCAAGKFKSYPVKVKADQPRHCGKSVRYSRLTIMYTAAKPKGTPAKDVHKFTCKS